MGERAARGADHGIEADAGGLIHDLFGGKHVAEPADAIAIVCIGGSTSYAKQQPAERRDRLAALTLVTRRRNAHTGSMSTEALMC